MASTGRGTGTSIVDRIIAAPYRYDWFQAVRLLRLHAVEQAKRGTGRPLHDVGQDYGPDEEIVRFRALVSHSFPPSAIQSVRRRSDAESPDAVEMVVAFMGLTGPSGVLPQHYTQLVIDRVRRKDYSLRDYFDIFNHRVISLFYRAWEKYRVPVGYERARYQNDDDDLFMFCLRALVGLATGGLQNRLLVDDEAPLYYAGLFAHRTRNAVSLEQMLADYFDLNVQVKQFHGEWLYLRTQDQTRLPTVEEPDGCNAQLGVSVVVGERVWGVENSFQLRLGPLRYAEFKRFMPDGDLLAPLCQMTRLYVGPEFDFHVQPVLMAEETPWCRLVDGDDAARLGWNTWLRGEHVERDPDDAVFRHDGYPLAP